jgi:hypothetical protein
LVRIRPSDGFCVGFLNVTNFSWSKPLHGWPYWKAPNNPIARNSFPLWAVSNHCQGMRESSENLRGRVRRWRFRLPALNSFCLCKLSKDGDCWPLRLPTISSNVVNVGRFIHTRDSESFDPFGEKRRCVLLPKALAFYVVGEPLECERVVRQMGE